MWIWKVKKQQQNISTLTLKTSKWGKKLGKISVYYAVYSAVTQNINTYCMKQIPSWNPDIINEDLWYF